MFWLIILLLCTVPGMNGLEMLKQLRELGFGDIPAVMISGEHSEQIVVKAMEVGIFDFIFKPFNVESMVRPPTRVLDAVWR